MKLLFCGTGVENARYMGEQCAKVIACVKHDANAIASHAANHPDALHFTEDIRTLELSTLIDHVSKMRHQYPDALVVLWALLECDAVMFMPGWTKSRGCRLEYQAAKIYEKQRLFFKN